MVTASSPRPTCSRCRRPRRVCYCAALPTLPTTTRVVILQHPRERDMPIGTARMASLCLPSSELHVGIDWSAHEPLRAALADPTRTPILLWPGAGARDILAEPPGGPVTLVVVDGTWSQAKTVVRDNPILRALPRYAFATPEPSRYRIRREPDPAYCSTIEALMHVLGALEGDPSRFRALRDPLDAMVDAQLACRAERPQRRVRLRRKLPRIERLPPELRDRFADLVVVVGEANAWPYDARCSGPSGGGRAPDDDLVHWVALRPATGALFERIVMPRRPLAPSTAFHTRISEAALRAGDDRAAVVEAFARFARPTDAVAAWGRYAPDLFVAAGGALPVERLDLRALAQRLENRRMGGLERYAASVEGELPPVRAAGRAGARIAALAKVIAAWRS